MNSRRILTVSLILGAMLSGSALGQPPIDCNGTSCTVAGSIMDNVTFEAGNTYLLHGQVVVEEPAVLTIEAGTLIHGSSDPIGALIISQGAQIRANGTADAPIVMSSSKPVDERAPADWGGLVINGRAPINNPGGTSQQGNIRGRQAHGRQWSPPLRAHRVRRRRLHTRRGLRRVLVPGRRIYNLTVIGNYGVRGVLPETDDPLSNNGILLRRGTGAIIRNFIVTGFARSAVEIDHAATFALAADERLSFASGIVDHNCAIAACSGQFVIDEDDMAAPRPPSSIVMGAPYVTAVNPMLFHPYDEEDPDFTRVRCRRLSPAESGPTFHRTTGSSRWPPTSARSAGLTTCGGRVGRASPADDRVADEDTRGLAMRNIGLHAGRGKPPGRRGGGRIEQQRLSEDDSLTVRSGLSSVVLALTAGS